jgi:hypothetical protein
MLGIGGPGPTSQRRRDQAVSVGEKEGIRHLAILPAAPQLLGEQEVA